MELLWETRKRKVVTEKKINMIMELPWEKKFLTSI